MIEQTDNEIKAELLSFIKNEIYIAGDTNLETEYDKGWNAAVDSFERVINKLITPEINSIILDKHN